MILGGVVPARGLAFIRHVETEECYQNGSIVIPEQARDKVAKLQMIVVAVGLWERCDDEDCLREPHQILGPSHEPGMFDAGRLHFCEVEAGDWVICRNRSWSLTPDPDIFVIRQSDILGVFEEKERR